MREMLNKIRKPEYLPASKKIMYSVMILTVGAALGIISKALDETASNLLPAFLEVLDLRNFFSRMGVWMFIGICISIYSKSPLRAALYTFLFFTGMVASYYIYTVTVAHFFPKSYMMIWIAMTILSPFLGAVCWYAKGTHAVSICISSLVFMMMTRQAFVFGFLYFNVRYVLELLLWAATIIVLYKNPKQIVWVMGIGASLFFVTASRLNLFWGMM